MLVIDIFDDFNHIEEAKSFLEMSLKSGVNIIQFRDNKSNKFQEKFDMINNLKINFPKSKLIVNSDIKLAKESLADGIHIKESNWNKDIVDISNDLIIGKSVHYNNIKNSKSNISPNYVIFGTIFKSKTHPNIHPIGINKFTELNNIYKSPVIAIGGINESNTELVINSGANGVAIKSGIIKNKDPEKTIIQIKKILLK
jgi:thiamine-phosphate diphosphorylase